MYELLLLVGGLGFFAMALLGMMHTGGGGHGHSHGHAGHVDALSHNGGQVITHPSQVGHGHADGPGPGDTSVAHHLGHLPTLRGAHVPKGFRGGPGGRSRASGLLMLISPIDLFALALGAGATGVLLKQVVSPQLLVWLALVGALVFDFLVIKPAFMFVMRFVSKPSEGLEGTVQLRGVAVTKFDREGKGLVQLTLDGQIIQLLASLSVAERELGESVARGDDVTVLEVDAKHNTCTVSKLMSV